MTLFNKKERTGRVAMPEQPAKVRRHNFDEVALGYTAAEAIAEASRCIQCRVPRCVEGCPVNVNIPKFIKFIAEGNPEGAAEKLFETNMLPAICGRVCPQETQCEELCILGKKGEPIAIGRLERYAADEARAVGNRSCKIGDGTEIEEGVPGAGCISAPTGKTAAVIGAGPAGLTAAADLAKAGHKVTIFESLHLPGGVLTYGIPGFRLPKSIVKAEIDDVLALGVELKTDYVIGRIKTLDEIAREYDAVFLGTGAGLPNFMGIEGENLNGVYSANEFLTRVNLMKAYEADADTMIRKGKNVVVVGGGNVAMDAARSALRLGAENVTIVYRRSDAELPARREEIEHAKHEGIEFCLLANPTRIIGDYGDGTPQGRKFDVKAVECIRMDLSEPDESGRKSPKPVPGSEFMIDADVVIIAIGTAPNPLIYIGATGIEKTKRGTIIVDDDLRSTKENIFAGGDVVTGAATVISAMGAGKKAAAEMDKYLMRK
ncbi:NADPH-dependent glutamate synthase [Methanimicrococcus blatticola]|uniref:Sulfide dehydrogenase (Flavoprotein) subunit SudA n=1 Tax=Methanimicrococcus blatticola TaxID=91560 RepID=A0A484F3R4_9EURY|nr:NADPH-dependent glutamate synthase [Methanimicrococcus blatticola]MBZ3936027.1 NADPH-dependent glutamate synthase [Methanimicrococcus blatticola]MCC2509361.1 NADPH-dependent glutamate synthase [Methanimicrococcus blatticola]TDQ68243.1 sulfide dehydrogenase (flavoprotein) subunit SudA [Methanimicrococcus blatticola]